VGQCATHRSLGRHGDLTSFRLGAYSQTGMGARTWPFLFTPTRTLRQRSSRAEGRRSSVGDSHAEADILCMPWGEILTLSGEIRSAARGGPSPAHALSDLPNRVDGIQSKNLLILIQSRAWIDSLTRCMVFAFSDASPPRPHGEAEASKEKRAMKSVLLAAVLTASVISQNGTGGERRRVGHFRTGRKRP
jgi:hypothetical protein